MTKDNPSHPGILDSSSPFVAMMKDIKAEILNQVKASEESMKAELRSSIEITNDKVSKLSNTVIENSGKISAIEKWI